MLAYEGLLALAMSVSNHRRGNVMDFNSRPGPGLGSRHQDLGVCVVPGADHLIGCAALCSVWLCPGLL